MDTWVAVTKTDWGNLLKATDKPESCKRLLPTGEAVLLMVSRTVSEDSSNVSKAKRIHSMPTEL